MASPPAQGPRPDPEDAEAVAQQAGSTIEVGIESGDPGYESDWASRASTSISSSVRDYSFEHGRRYHKYHEGKYLFPNDESEQEREDMKHAMILNVCGGHLHYAPLENPQQILDIGTGTGIWAIDSKFQSDMYIHVAFAFTNMLVADEYPSASVLGIDLSPIQPSWVPPNVRFMVDDAEVSWVHPHDHFDFIHARHLASSIKDFPKLIAQAKR
jgi:hypothetical protein